MFYSAWNTAGYGKNDAGSRGQVSHYNLLAWLRHLLRELNKQQRPDCEAYAYRYSVSGIFVPATGMF